LDDIFEGTTQQTLRVVIPPTKTVENVAPPRVQNTVSPTRVQNTAAQQRLAKQTTSSHLTPNSHRRKHTPHRRAATPTTPHVMVRCSAGQKYNLSQDMIAETINQANHCFSIPTTAGPRNTEKVKGNNQITIMPEMTNAVICPEKGKSLKHQELITKLRYKIKWIRFTANEINRPTQHTHGLWKHGTRPITFSLVVDDFGGKYVGREHAEYLMECIKKIYNISSDWKGSAYCGLTLEGDYKDGTL
jgi:hypothetical protein